MDATQEGGGALYTWILLPQQKLCIQNRVQLQKGNNQSIRLACWTACHLAPQTPFIGDSESSPTSYTILGSEQTEANKLPSSYKNNLGLFIRAFGRWFGSTFLNVAACPSERCSYLSAVITLPLPVRVKGHSDRSSRNKAEYQREESRNSRLREEETDRRNQPGEVSTRRAGRSRGRYKWHEGKKRRNAQRRREAKRTFIKRLPLCPLWPQAECKPKKLLVVQVKLERHRLHSCCGRVLRRVCTPPWCPTAAAVDAAGGLAKKASKSAPES